MRPISLAVAVTVAIASGCASSQPTSISAPSAGILFPAPPDPMVRVRQAGLVPETHESLEHHVHAHLDLFVDGKHVVVPGGIGIDTTDPAVHQGTVDGQPAWGGITKACSQPCISPLHTHDVTGILHTESATSNDNTLGQFFVEWGVPLTPTCVASRCRPESTIAVYVNGKPFTGDPQTIPLTNHKEVAIVVGPAPSKIPSSADFSGA